MDYLMDAAIFYGSIGAWVAAALVLGLAAPVAVLAVARWPSNPLPRFAAPAALLIVGAVSLVFGATSPRILNGNQTLESIGVSGAEAWSSRVGTALLFTISLALLVQSLSRRDRAAPAAKALALSYLAFFGTTVVLAGLGGTEPAFKFKSLYPLVVLPAFMLAAYPRGIGPIVTSFRVSLGGLVYASAAAAIIAPKWAIYEDAQELIPGIGRLYGVTSHANTIGMIAATLLCVELFWPAPGRWRWLNLIAAASVLAMAQSKTAWIFSVLVVTWLALGAGAGQRSWSLSRRLPVLLPRMLILALVSLAAWLLVGDEVVAYVTRRLPSVDSLSGRDRIWAITLEQWQANPLFGYGPNLWDFDFRARHNLFEAGMAHNQFVQTLGAAGLLGMAGLLAYLGTLVWASVRSSEATRGLGLVLTVDLVVRCITEAPFESGVMDPVFLVHLGAVTLISAALNQPGSNLVKRSDPPLRVIEARSGT